VAANKLLIFTDARLGEILCLTWASVDLERNLLLLPDSQDRPEDHPPQRAGRRDPERPAARGKEAPT
jgi:hypothetical protein